MSDPFCQAVRRISLCSVSGPGQMTCQGEMTQSSGSCLISHTIISPLHPVHVLV